MKHQANNQQQGQKGESLAAAHLIQNGLVLIERNFNCKFGEIDIIAHDNNCWVFTEVKLRRTQQYGGGLAAITKGKQQKLQRTAQIYLNQHGLNPNHTEMRFDVVTITEQPYQIRWIKNAFGE